MYDKATELYTVFGLLVVFLRFSVLITRESRTTVNTVTNSVDRLLSAINNEQPAALLCRPIWV